MSGSPATGSAVLWPAVLLSGQWVPAPGATGNGLLITAGRQIITRIFVHLIAPFPVPAIQPVLYSQKRTHCH